MTDISMDKESAREEYKRLGKQAEVIRAALNEYMKDGVPRDDIRLTLAKGKAMEMQRLFSRMRELEDIFT